MFNAGWELGGTALDLRADSGKYGVEFVRASPVFFTALVCR